LSGFYRALARLFPPDLSSVRALVSAARAPRPLDEYLKAVLGLADLRLREIMVPRVDVVVISANASVVETARELAECGHTRAPVYRETFDHPIGIVHALDVMRELSTVAEPERVTPNAGDLARPGLPLPETLSASDAIQAMRSEAAHIALVLDEHGGFAGLVTLEDLFEQIAGPVPDEYADEGRESIRAVEDGSAVVGAATRLHQLQRILGVRFPRTRFSSIGGLVYDHLGRVPRPGETVKLPGISIQVLSVEGTRLQDLRVEVVTAAARRSALIEVGLGKEVVCGNDVVGRVERVVADPGAARATAIVVRSGSRSVVVPLEFIERSDQDVAYLRADACDLGRFPDHVTGTVSVGTRVSCSDGPAGRVTRLVLDRESGVVSHFVVRTASGLLPRKDVVVPMGWARSITSEEIELGARCDALLELPEFREDDQITVAVLQRLGEDPRFQGLDRYTQKIEVYGGLVRLSGRVRTRALKQAAEELALTTAGVLSVDNRLIADEELVSDVERAVQREGLDIDDLEVTALLGRVTLRGRAATADVRAAAEKLAASVPGVASVVNELSLQEPPVPARSGGEPVNEPRN
jgi:Mg2+/Co2+ transporter CorC/osmotically-inducible protein OsmY